MISEENYSVQVETRLVVKASSKVSFDQFSKFIKLRESMQVDKHALSDIEDHLTLLRSKFDYLFPAEKVAPFWIQNPFLLNIDDVEENLQEEILDLKASESANTMFTASNLTEFSLSQTEVCKHIIKIALNHLLLFATTYLCKQGSQR